MARVEVPMPQMGESIAEGTVSVWLKKVGRHASSATSRSWRSPPTRWTRRSRRRPPACWRRSWCRRGRRWRWGRSSPTSRRRRAPRRRAAARRPPGTRAPQPQTPQEAPAAPIAGEAQPEARRDARRRAGRRRGGQPRGAAAHPLLAARAADRRGARRRPRRGPRHRPHGPGDQGRHPRLRGAEAARRRPGRAAATERRAPRARPPPRARRSPGTDFYGQVEHPTVEVGPARPRGADEPHDPAHRRAHGPLAAHLAARPLLLRGGLLAHRPGAREEPAHLGGAGGEGQLHGVHRQGGRHRAARAPEGQRLRLRRPAWSTAAR